MKSFFRTMPALAAFMATLTGFAAEEIPPTCCPELLSMTSPCYTVAADFNALFLQASAGNLAYAAEAIPLPLLSPNWKIHSIDTDYHFGFDLSLSGVFQNAHAALSCDWQHFHAGDESSVNVGDSNMIGPFFEIGPDASPYKVVRGKARYKFDEVSLDYGLFINLGPRLMTQFFVGISYVQLKERVAAFFSSLDGTITRSIKVPSHYKGAGPQVGINFAYQIVKGFKLMGAGCSSLFIGPQKNHTSYETASPAIVSLGGTSPNFQKTTVDKGTVVVPGYEGKLGLAYAFEFGRGYQIKLEAGYEAKIYIDIIHSVDMSSEVLTPPVAPNTVGVYARTFHSNWSNFALAGPYASLSMAF